MALEEVLDRILGSGRHMDLRTAEVINCGISVNYVPKHGELMSFAWKIGEHMANSTVK